MATITPIVKFKKEPFSSARVRASVLNELKRQGNIAKIYMNLTTEYWNDRPTFTVKIFYAKASPWLFIFPDKAGGSWEGADHWEKINEGTAQELVGYSKDFVPKTESPGALGTNIPGFGRAFYSPYARKGIIPRHWDEVFQKTMENDFTLSIGEAIKKGLQPK